jgi:hypothetical protein
MERDMAAMESARALRTKNKTKQNGRKRDPNVAWILDFNNDGIVSMEEIEAADTILQNEPSIKPIFSKDEL